MNIERLPSGSYRVRQTIDGKRYYVTFDHKPTNSEVTKALADKINSKTISNNSTVQRACEAYIESKSNVLSPATIRGYYTIIRQISPSFASKTLQVMSLPALQTEVNRYSSTHSAKSTKNYAGFLQSVFRFYGLEFPQVTLPQKEKNMDYIPSTEDMRKIFEYFKGSRFEIAISLAALGLRRSEICALTIDDLNGRMLTINKAKVQNEKKQWVIKTTKTSDSTRTISIPPDLADLIRETGYIYQGDPEIIYCALMRAQKDLGLPHFSLHKLRHFFASYMHDLGYSDKQIQEFGGWKTDLIMKTVYQHAMDMEETKNKMADNIGDLFNKQ